jgi:Asp/Glu/hydantoin racemase
MAYDTHRTTGQPVDLSVEARGVVMRETVVMVHTIPLLVGAFTEWATGSLPDCDVRHVLDEPLLARIRRRGAVAISDDERVLDHVRLAEEIGAVAVLVTCSTASESVSRIKSQARIPVIAIDDAMMADAVRRGPRIGLVATSPTTLGPSEHGLRHAAFDAGREIEVTTVLVEDALAALLRGDTDTHDRLVAAAVRSLRARVDVIVLAQATMARTSGMLAEETPDVPVLASPTLALAELQRAIQASERSVGLSQGSESPS